MTNPQQDNRQNHRQDNRQDNRVVYDHHARAFGYLNRARKVPVRNGTDYLAVDFTALEGIVRDTDDKAQWDALNRTRYTARVSGAGAQRLITDFMQAINDRETTVCARVTLGVSCPEIFTHQKGSKAGQQDVSLRSRLLYVAYLKVGDTVIDLESYNASHDDTMDEEAHVDISDQDDGGEPAQSVRLAAM